MKNLTEQVTESSKGSAEGNKAVLAWKIATSVFLQATLDGGGNMHLWLIWDPMRCGLACPQDLKLSALGFEDVPMEETVGDSITHHAAEDCRLPESLFQFPLLEMGMDARKLLGIGVPIAKRLLELRGDHNIWLRSPRRIYSSS